MYKEYFFTRYDDNGFTKYFSAEDFEGLLSEKFEFESFQKNKLVGYFYNYSDFKKDKLIIFVHGLGGGHKSYMREIELLCKEGYQVFSYDHTGCMESEGKDQIGACQYISDLDDCINALKNKDKIINKQLYVIGHSIGAYATMNILNFHTDIKKIVAISGITSVNAMAEQFSKTSDDNINYILERENSINTKYANCDALQVLQNTNAKALIIHSSDDTVVDPKYSYDKLFQKFKYSKNIKFISESGKVHNPNYSLDAVEYLKTFFATLQTNTPKTEEEKIAFKNSFDWLKMTEQDKNIWSKIFSFFL